MFLGDQWNKAKNNTESNRTKSDKQPLKGHKNEKKRNKSHNVTPKKTEEQNREKVS